MSGGVPSCHTIIVHAFRGARGRAGIEIRRQLDRAKSPGQPDVRLLDCLIYAGHTGVSLDPHRVIYGFTPQQGIIPVWQMMQRLLNGEALDAVVQDDTGVFNAAGKRGLTIQNFSVILPDKAFQEFEQRLKAELAGTGYGYGFPNGDGDCNCTTWLERLALPLLTGSMEEFTRLPGFATYPDRRFGRCV